MIRHEDWVSYLNPTYGSLFSPDRDPRGEFFGVAVRRQPDRVPKAVAVLRELLR
ncbi:MAG: hypothetical protein GDA43_05985 [Hormoscilla sp. SP5CHS1]|nr:hypothetical protein [Hormoscilla sp. SP12CHS1]MBC6452800.1 hypothetical protein [Hormoscilla sp. SP5CHS1]